jgi:hypothetical protein
VQNNYMRVPVPIERMTHCQADVVRLQVFYEVEASKWIMLVEKCMSAGSLST